MSDIFHLNDTLEKTAANYVSLSPLSFISRFKAPKKVSFGPLPTSSTGKIQKFLLRRQLETSLSA